MKNFGLAFIASAAIASAASAGVITIDPCSHGTCVGQCLAQIEEKEHDIGGCTNDNSPSPGDGVESDMFCSKVTSGTTAQNGSWATLKCISGTCTVEGRLRCQVAGSTMVKRPFFSITCPKEASQHHANPDNGVPTVEVTKDSAHCYQPDYTIYAECADDGSGRLQEGISQIR